MISRERILIVNHKEASPDTAVMMMASLVSRDAAVDVLGHGACDYLHKPPELDDFFGGGIPRIRKAEPAAWPPA